MKETERQEIKMYYQKRRVEVRQTQTAQKEKR
jgi:hypothetical protein